MVFQVPSKPCHDQILMCRKAVICGRLSRWRKPSSRPFPQAHPLPPAPFRAGAVAHVEAACLFKRREKKKRRKLNGFSERVNGCCDSSFLVRSGKAEGGGILFSDTSKASLQLRRHMRGISHCVLVQQNPFSSLNSILLSL